ncbi:hypothetical protein ABPG74_015610 [Tetrahymena malaccensis]
MDLKQGLALTGSISFGVIGSIVANLLYKNIQKKKKKDQVEYDGFLAEQDDVIEEEIDFKYRVSSRKKTATIHSDSENIQIERQRLKISAKLHVDNHLVEELRFLDSPLCEIERVHNLIIDRGLTQIDDIVTKKAESMPKGAFIFTNTFILNKVEYGPTCMIQSAKRWLRAGPRYNLYFQPQEVKALVLSVGSIVPGINVVIREIVRALNNNYGANQVYGARFGYKGVIEENFIDLSKNLADNVHSTGGSFLGVCRGGFNLNLILKVLIKHGFNQLYIIGGDGAMRSAQALQAEIAKKKHNIAICVIPKSVQGDIPIAEEQMGFQTTIEETAKAVEVGFVESQSHEYGIGLIRCFGRNAGFVASHVAEATGCVDVVLVPEFQWDLYGEKGVLEYIRSQIKVKKHLIIIVSEGSVNSLRDVHLPELGEDESGNKIYINIGEFLKDKIIQYCEDKKQPIIIKFIDPLYITRACRANPHDTKICSQMAQNAVHGCMAGFTGFAVVIVHHKTAFVPLSEMVSGHYENKLVPHNRHWQRVLAQTLQPSFINNEEEHLKQQEQEIKAI